MTTATESLCRWAPPLALLQPVSSSVSTADGLSSSSSKAGSVLRRLRPPIDDEHSVARVGLIACAPDGRPTPLRDQPPARTQDLRSPRLAAADGVPDERLRTPAQRRPRANHDRACAWRAPTGAPTHERKRRLAGAFESRRAQIACVSKRIVRRTSDDATQDLTPDVFSAARSHPTLRGASALRPSDQ